MSSKYLDATPEEREEWVKAYVERRKAQGFTKRGPRWNNKGAGRALKGSMSVHSTLRHKAKTQWQNKVKKAERRRDGKQEIQTTTTT